MTSGTGYALISQPFTLSNVPYTISVWAKLIVGTAPLKLVIGSAWANEYALTTTLTRGFGTVAPPAGLNDTYIVINVPGGGSTNGIYGAQLETGSTPTSYIPTTTTSVTRAADAAVLTIPAGVNALLYTFDDNSTQQVSVTPGSYTIPTVERAQYQVHPGPERLRFYDRHFAAGNYVHAGQYRHYFDSGNILRTASNNGAHELRGGVSCLLIEGSATNVLLQSNNFSTTWVMNNASTFAAAQFISPDGTNNGWSVTNGAAVYGGIISNSVVFSNIPYAASIWAKLITGTAPIAINISAVQSSLIPTTAVTTRVSAVLTPSAGSGQTVFYRAPGVVGDVEGFYGAQLETGSVMTSYIPTTTAAVTRQADSATFTIPAGVTQLTYTFDDNSTQTVAVTAGSYTIPTNLARPNIKSIAWVTQTTFGAIITLQCAKCGFYMKLTNPHDATMIAAKHQAG